MHITTRGTGDKYYNRGNRGCIIATGGTGDALLQQGEQEMHYYKGNTGMHIHNQILLQLSKG